MTQPNMKICSKCKALKPIGDYYSQIGTSTGVHAACKNCEYTPRPRIPVKDAVYRLLYDSCKNAAKFRDLSFELTRAQHKIIISNSCFHCGDPPVAYNPYLKQKKAASATRQREGWIFKHGVDRISNDLGYIMSNCVSCCTQCNYSRQDYTVEEFVTHCAKVNVYQEKQRCQKT